MLRPKSVSFIKQYGSDETNKTLPGWNETFCKIFIYWNEIIDQSHLVEVISCVINLHMKRSIGKVDSDYILSTFIKTIESC